MQTKINLEKIKQDAIQRNYGNDRGLNISQNNQLWGSTALGFSNLVGCAVMTNAITTVVEIENKIFVYFDEEYAYEIDKNQINENQLQALNECNGNYPSTANIENIGARIV